MPMTTTPRPPRKGAVPLADLPPISAADTSAESQADRLFAEPLPPPPYPAIELETMVSYEGFTFRVVFRDTSIAAAAEVLKKRGCVPASAAPAPPSQANAGHAPMLSEPPMCPQHAPRKMKPMKHPSRQGHSWMCTFQYDTGDYCTERV
jgi:hypothetical protein